jgi:HD-like signal output (HDOD) protein
MDKLLEKAHPAVGKLIMDTWDFPENLKPVASEYVNFQYKSADKSDYVDVVQVAFLQSIVGTDHPACRVDCSAVPSFAKLGFAADTEILEIEGISDEVEIARSLLS